jgi:hypothetical protein
MSHCQLMFTSPCCRHPVFTLNNATLTWSCPFGVSGMGAACHNVNPRLFPERIEYIVNHTKNRQLFLTLILPRSSSS